jgi:PAS domain S-box-containing protein
MAGGHLGAAERTAKAIANAVGDGCVVRLFDASTGGLETAAVAHRDRERRSALAALIGAPGLSPQLGWAADAYQRNVAFRLRYDAAIEATGVGAWADGVHAAVAAPFHVGGTPAGVVVALRDSSDFAYSLSEQQVVQELAAAPEPESAVTLPAAPASARVLELAPGAVWVTDLGGRTTYVNHAACQLAGVPSADLIGADIAAFFEAGALPLSADAVDERLRRPDGTTVWVNIVAAPLTDDAGRTLGTVRTLTDVGDRRRVEVAARMSAEVYGSIAELTELALTGEEFAVLADEAVELVADLLGAEYVSIGEVDPCRESVVARAVYGWPRELVGSRYPLPDLSACRLCLDEDGPIVIRDYRELDRLEVGELVESGEILSGFFVRVAGGAGVLSAHSPRTDAFAREDVAALGLLTSVLGARWEPRIAPLTAVC